MTMHLIRNRDEATDGLYDCSPGHLATVFGRRTLDYIREGRDPFVAARLAFTFAARALPVFVREDEAEDM